jgi:hypothetical protein
MKGVAISAYAVCALGLLAVGCSNLLRRADRHQAEFGRFPEREFVRLTLDKSQWRPTEGNTLGVQTAVLEGDPSKPGLSHDQPVSSGSHEPAALSPGRTERYRHQGNVVHRRRNRVPAGQDRRPEAWRVYAASSLMIVAEEPAARTTRADEMWHIATTVIHRLDGTPPACTR